MVPVSGSKVPSAAPPCAVYQTRPSGAGATSWGRLPAGTGYTLSCGSACDATTAEGTFPAEEVAAAIGLGADTEGSFPVTPVGREDVQAMVDIRAAVTTVTQRCAVRVKAVRARTPLYRRPAMHRRREDDFAFGRQ